MLAGIAVGLLGFAQDAGAIGVLSVHDAQGERRPRQR